VSTAAGDTTSKRHMQDAAATRSGGRCARLSHAGAALLVITPRQAACDPPPSWESCVLDTHGAWWRYDGGTSRTTRYNTRASVAHTHCLSTSACCVQHSHAAATHKASHTHGQRAMWPPHARPPFPCARTRAPVVANPSHGARSAQHQHKAGRRWVASACRAPRVRPQVQGALHTP
jgi:hypothetical protein